MNNPDDMTAQLAAALAAARAECAFGRIEVEIFRQIDDARIVLRATIEDAKQDNRAR